MKLSIERPATMCKALEEDLVLYYYGELDGSDTARIEHHVSDCAGCRHFLGDLQRLLPQMAIPQDLPQSFWDDYYRETVAKLASHREQRDGWRNLFAPMRMWLIPAFGTAAVAAVAFSMILGTPDLDFLRGQAQERIPQEIVIDSDQLEFFKTMDMLESLSALERLEARPITSQPQVSAT